MTRVNPNMRESKPIKNSNAKMFELKKPNFKKILTQINLNLK